MLENFSDPSKVAREVLNMLEQTPWFSVQPQQAMFDMVMFSFPGRNMLEEEKDWNLWHLILNYGAWSLDMRTEIQEQ